MKTIDKVITGLILSLGLGALITMGIKDNRDWKYYATVGGLTTLSVSAGAVIGHYLKKEDDEFKRFLSNQNADGRNEEHNSAYKG